MSYSGKLELRNKAIELRKQGTSMREIQKLLTVSKSSVSRWVQDVVLTDDQVIKLYANKKTGGLKGNYVASQNKIARRKLLTKELLDKGIMEVGHLSKRDRFIAGIALYFGEGDKTDKSIGFTNSDSRSIDFMSKWLREFCKIDESKFRGKLYIHDTLDEHSAKTYWSKLTCIPLEQFTKSTIVPHNSERRRKSILPHGVFKIVINDINLHRKMMGWISGLFKL